MPAPGDAPDAGMLMSVGRPLPAPLQAVPGISLRLEPLIAVYGYPGVTAEDDLAFRHGRLEFHLQEIQGLVSFITYIGGLGWTETLFSAQSLRDEEFSKPDPDPSMGYGLHMVLVDVETKIIKSMRMVGLSYAFSGELYGLWDRLRRGEPMSNFDFNRRAQLVMAQFTGPSALAEMAKCTYMMPGLE